MNLQGRGSYGFSDRSYLPHQPSPIRAREQTDIRTPRNPAYAAKPLTPWERGLKSSGVSVSRLDSKTPGPLARHSKIKGGYRQSPYPAPVPLRPCQRHNHLQPQTFSSPVLSRIEPAPFQGPRNHQTGLSPYPGFGLVEPRQLYQEESVQTQMLNRPWTNTTETMAFQRPGNFTERIPLPPVVDQSEPARSQGQGAFRIRTLITPILDENEPPMRFQRKGDFQDRIPPYSAVAQTKPTLFQKGPQQARVLPELQVAKNQSLQQRDPVRLPQFLKLPNQIGAPSKIPQTNPVAQSREREKVTVKTGVDLLPHCTMQGSLTKQEVISLSDVAGDLREVVLLALGGYVEQDGRDVLDGALGNHTAEGVREFWKEELFMDA